MLSRGTRLASTLNRSIHGLPRRTLPCAFSPAGNSRNGTHCRHPRAERVFFDCWTRKEACLKGRAEGLSLPLNELEVWSADDESASSYSMGARLGRCAR